MAFSAIALAHRTQPVGNLRARHPLRHVPAARSVTVLAAHIDQLFSRKLTLVAGERPEADRMASDAIRVGIGADGFEGSEGARMAGI